MSTIKRRQREKELRRQSILEHAEKIFAQKGYNEAQMDQIAAAAELSKGTLYLYFKSKEELAFAVFHKNLLTLKKMIQEASVSVERGIEKVQGISKAYYRFYKDHFLVEPSKGAESHNRQYLNRLLEYYIEGTQLTHPHAEQCLNEIEEILSIIVSTLQGGIQDGSIRKEIDPGKTAFTYGNLVLLFMLRLSQRRTLVLQGRGYSAEELFDYMFELFLHSLSQEAFLDVSKNPLPSTDYFNINSHPNHLPRAANSQLKD